MFRNPTTDLIIFLVVVLLIFGPKRLPLLGRQLGQGMREFKDGITGKSKDSENEERAEITQTSEATAQPTPVPTQQREAAEVTTPERPA